MNCFYDFISFLCISVSSMARKLSQPASFPISIDIAKLKNNANRRRFLIETTIFLFKMKIYFQTNCLNWIYQLALHFTSSGKTLRCFIHSRKLKHRQSDSEIRLFRKKNKNCIRWDWRDVRLRKKNCNGKHYFHRYNYASFTVIHFQTNLPVSSSILCSTVVKTSSTASLIYFL